MDTVKLVKIGHGVEVHGVKPGKGGVPLCGLRTRNVDHAQTVTELGEGNMDQVTCEKCKVCKGPRMNKIVIKDGVQYVNIGRGILVPLEG